MTREERIIYQKNRLVFLIKNTAHRNFRFIILIISQGKFSAENQEYLKNLILNKNLSFVSVELMKEEQLYSK